MPTDEPKGLRDDDVAAFYSSEALWPLGALVGLRNAFVFDLRSSDASDETKRFCQHRIAIIDAEFERRSKRT